MTLIVDELFNGVTFEQNFRINRSLSLAHFRPWIIKWGTPTSGDMVLQILKDGNLLRESRINYADINANISSTYFHGQLRFDVEPLKLNHDRQASYTEFTAKIFMDGYTNDSNNFYGVIRRYENKFYDTYGLDVFNNEAPNDMVEPLGFELFEYTY